DKFLRFDESNSVPKVFVDFQYCHRTRCGIIRPSLTYDNFAPKGRLMSRIAVTLVASVRLVADVLGLLRTSRRLKQSLSSRLTRPALAAIVLATLLPQMRGQAQSTDALSYAKGYLLTGDYVVGGVDLIGSTAVGGFATGTISISGVPDNADIIAAYLY